MLSISSDEEDSEVVLKPNVDSSGEAVPKPLIKSEDNFSSQQEEEELNLSVEQRRAMCAVQVCKGKRLKYLRTKFSAVLRDFLHLCSLEFSQIRCPP